MTAVVSRILPRVAFPMAAREAERSSDNRLHDWKGKDKR